MDMINYSKIKKVEEQIDNLSSQVGTIETQTLPESYLSSRNISSLSKRGKLDVGLYGMTVENLITNGSFSNGLTDWIYDKVSVVNGELVLDTSLLAYLYKDVTFAANNKYYIALKAYGGGKFMLRAVTALDTVISSILTFETNSTKSIKSAILTTTEDGTRLRTNRVDDTGIVYLDDYFLINLTAMFGAGNEPIKEQCDLMFPKYFDGLQGATNIEVTSCGKNLFDKDTADLTGDLNDLGEVRTFEGRFTSDFIRIKYNTYYTKNYSKYYRTAFYDNNKNYISSSLSQTFLTPVGAVYLRVAEDVSNINSFQLEEGDTATDREEYIKPTSNLYKTLDGEVITLHRVPNGVCDEKDVNGKLIKRVSNKLILNGSEDWATGSAELDNTVSFKVKIVNGAPSTIGLSDFAEFVESGMSKIDKECFQLIDDDLYVRILKSRLTVTSVTGLKEWLLNNSISIIYQLAQPQIIDTNEVPMVAEPNGHVFISTDGCLPSNIIAYPINMGAQTDGLIEGQKQHSELLKHQNVVNIEFDLRITALEP